MLRTIVSIALGVLCLTGCRASESATSDPGGPVAPPSASEATASGLRVGDVAPDFTLPASDGTTVALGDHLSTGPVVVVFYRGDW